MQAIVPCCLSEELITLFSSVTGKSHGLHRSGVFNIQLNRKHEIEYHTVLSKNSQDIIGHPSGKES